MYSLIIFLIAIVIFGTALLTPLESAKIYREKIYQELSAFKKEFHKFKQEIKAILNR